MTMSFGRREALISSTRRSDGASHAASHAAIGCCASRLLIRGRRFFTPKPGAHGSSAGTREGAYGPSPGARVPQEGGVGTSLGGGSASGVSIGGAGGTSTNVASCAVPTAVAARPVMVSLRC